jgi:hypothetical protein
MREINRPSGEKGKELLDQMDRKYPGTKDQVEKIWEAGFVAIHITPFRNELNSTLEILDKSIGSSTTEQSLESRMERISHRHVTVVPMSEKVKQLEQAAQIGNRATFDSKIGEILEQAEKGFRKDKEVKEKAKVMLRNVAPKNDLHYPDDNYLWGV